MRASVSSTSFKSGYDILYVVAGRKFHQARPRLSVLDAWWCLVHSSQILGFGLLQVEMPTLSLWERDEMGPTSTIHQGNTEIF